MTEPKHVDLRLRLSEFLGESRIAPEQTPAAEGGALNPQQRKDLIAVINQR